MYKKMTINPSVSANIGPMTFFQQNAVKTKSRGIYDLDEYATHTHPDAVNYLEDLAQDILAPCFGAAYGYPVLVHPANGTLFAMMSGTGYTLVRLPANRRQQILDLESDHIRSAHNDSYFHAFGEEWIIFDIFQFPKHLVIFWLHCAYSYSEESGED